MMLPWIQLCLVVLYACNMVTREMTDCNIPYHPTTVATTGKFDESSLEQLWLWWTGWHGTYKGFVKVLIVGHISWLKSTLNNQSCPLSEFPTVCYLRVVGMTDVLLSIYSKRWYGCYSDIFKDSINHTH